jgi:hypothetical protein
MTVCSLQPLVTFNDTRVCEETQRPLPTLRQNADYSAFKKSAVNGGKVRVSE